MSRNLSITRTAWGDGAPDWVLALARAADASSQVAIAERLGVSPAAINQVLRNRYQAGTHRIEQRVAGLLLAATVECPALGTLAVDLCQENQDRARDFTDTSSHRALMRRACRQCPHSRFTKETEAA